MNFQKINEIFTADFNIDGINCPRRNWNESTRYNHLTAPKPRTGIMMLTDYPALFRFPDGSTVQYNPGDVLLLPQGARYALRFLVPPGKQTHPIVVHFRITLPQGEPVQFGENVDCLCHDNGTLQPIFSDLVQLYKTGTPAALKAKLFALFDRLFPLQEADPCCIGYINRHYAGHFSIPLLAKRCGMSESAYRKRFRELTECSPVQYINRLKIGKACQMLLDGDMRLQDISDFLNFYSLPYFYKVFRDVTGMTPKEYCLQASNL